MWVRGQARKSRYSVGSGSFAFVENKLILRPPPPRERTFVLPVGEKKKPRLAGLQFSVTGAPG